MQNKSLRMNTYMAYYHLNTNCLTNDKKLMI